MRQWILSLTSASAVAALAKQFTPAGNVTKVTELLCGIMLMAVLIAPAVRMDIPALALSMTEYRRTAAELTQDAKTAEQQLLREYVERQCAAYITERAHNLGIQDVSIIVKTKWRDECWVPYEVHTEGAMSAEDREALAAYMESELGIPRERQIWNG